MSDPLQTDEIEDVLSSIRRLVSEEVRVTAQPDVMAPETPSSAPSSVAASEKLVLTPSQRVQKPAAEAQEPQEPQSKAEEQVTSEGRRVLNLSKGRSENVTAPEDAEIAANQESAAADANDEADAPETELTAAQDDAMPTAMWNSVRAPVDEYYDPADLEDDDYAGTAVDALDWRVSERPQSRTPLFSRPVKQDSVRQDPEARQPAEIEAQAVSNPDPTPQNASQESVIDEDMLRDLVGEIVRQELQGPLGERITRNVRKLVRREINRALAARDLG